MRLCRSNTVNTFKILLHSTYCQTRSPKFFSALWVPVWSKNKGGGGGWALPLDPPLGMCHPRGYHKWSIKRQGANSIFLVIGAAPIECFHMTSRWPYCCPKTMKRPPCWCPKPILWELNSFLMQTLSFVAINLHRCWPREWKHSIRERRLFQLRVKHWGEYREN